MTDPADLLRRLYDVAVARAQPSAVLPAHLPPPPRGRTVVIGAGKASGAMAQAVEACWPAGHALSGVVITRYGHVPPRQDSAGAGRVQILEAAHPVPDAQGVRATALLRAALHGLGPDDLVIALISGGGSALLTAPLPDWRLEDEQHLHRQLLRSGAPIGEMNVIRRHLSQVKGGRLALQCGPARLLTLALSDVPGDRLEDIASGPTVPDPSTCAEALALLERHGIALPDATLAALRQGDLETPKPGHPAFARHEARLIATPADMLHAAAQAAQALGWRVHVLSDELQGEARDVGALHAALARHVARRGQPFEAPCLLLSGGETTVTLPAGTSAEGSSGGRCSEFLLSAALALEGQAGVWMLAADTDGIDGHSAAAGAVIGPDTLPRAASLGLDPRAMLHRHDSGRFFATLGDAVMPGPTHTNVNDFRAVLIAP